MDSLCHRRAGRAGSARDGHRQDVEPGRCLRDLLLLRAVFVLELLQQALRLRPQPRSDGGDQSGAVHAAAHRQAGSGQLHGDKLSGRGVVCAPRVRVAVVDGDLSFEKGESGGVTMRAGREREIMGKTKISEQTERRTDPERFRLFRYFRLLRNLPCSIRCRTASLVILTIAISTIVAKAETLTVGLPPARFQTIQSAIAAANPGDVIRVQPGVYTGQFILDKRLAL